MHCSKTVPLILVVFWWLAFGCTSRSQTPGCAARETSVSPPTGAAATPALVLELTVDTPQPSKASDCKLHLQIINRSDHPVLLNWDNLNPSILLKMKRANGSPVYWYPPSVPQLEPVVLRIEAGKSERLPLDVNHTADSLDAPRYMIEARIEQSDPAHPQLWSGSATSNAVILGGKN